MGRAGWCSGPQTDRLHITRGVEFPRGPSRQEAQPRSGRGLHRTLRELALVTAMVLQHSALPAWPQPLGEQGL